MMLTAFCPGVDALPPLTRKRRIVTFFKNARSSPNSNAYHVKIRKRSIDQPITRESGAKSFETGHLNVLVAESDSAGGHDPDVFLSWAKPLPVALDRKAFDNVVPVVIKLKRAAVGNGIADHDGHAISNHLEVMLILYHHGNAAHRTAYRVRCAVEQIPARGDSNPAGRLNRSPECRRGIGKTGRVRSKIKNANRLHRIRRKSP